MDNDKDLTILLLLKDRALFTWRWMSYANKIRIPFKVFIADGGKDESVPKILSDKTHFPCVGYEYMRYPYDKTYSDYYAKVADALSRIHTPFVVITCNDDFCFVEGLRKAAAFLKANQYYVACAGDTNDFFVESCQRHGASPFYGSIVLLKKTNPAQDIVDDTAVGRLRFYFCGMVNSFLWSAVHRTDILRRSYRILAAAEPKDLFLSDHLVFSLTMSAGKIRREPGLYLFHQTNSQENVGAKIIQEFPTQLHWIQRKGWPEDFLKFTDAVGRAVSESDGISVEEARENFKLFYLSFIGKSVIRIYWPYIESYKTSGKLDHSQLPEQHSELKMIKQFLSEGPSVLEASIWRRRQKLTFVFKGALKRLKKRIAKQEQIKVLG